MNGQESGGGQFFEYSNCEQAAASLNQAAESAKLSSSGSTILDRRMSYEVASMMRGTCSASSWVCISRHR